VDITVFWSVLTNEGNRILPTWTPAKSLFIRLLEMFGICSGGRLVLSLNLSSLNSPDWKSIEDAILSEPDDGLR
jgi:hypothetical protein